MYLDVINASTIANSFFLYMFLYKKYSFNFWSRNSLWYSQLTL